jgi:hypothetical protein
MLNTDISREKLFEHLELARSGYASLILDARIKNDKIMELTCISYHKILNDYIVELGGESVDIPKI